MGKHKEGRERLGTAAEVRFEAELYKEGEVTR
jgi:hypothetical protein